MRKRLCSALMIASLFFGSLISHAQVYNGSLTLNSQADVDAFNYTSVTGILFLGNGTSDITNLAHLSTLTSIGQNMLINCPHLVNMNGLGNLQTITGVLVIDGCNSLQNLDGLTGLTSVHDLEIGGHLSYEGNESLKNIDGLSHVLSSSLKSVDIENNDSLTSINSLINFSTFPSNVIIKGNDMLTDISGLSNLTNIAGNFTIAGEALTNLNALSNLTSVGHTLSVGGYNLTDLSGLSNLTSVGDLEISASETNLDAFSNISSVHFLTLEHNDYLTNTDGLLNITQVHGGLLLDYNGFTNLHGLSNITTVDGLLSITYNDGLTNLDDLSSLTSVGFEISIHDNSKLIDFCGLYNLFNSGSVPSQIEVFRNGANTVSLAPLSVEGGNADEGKCSEVILHPQSPKINGCLVPITLSHTPYPSGNEFPVGTTNIIWTATDAANNSATTLQTIIVTDDQFPTITCPSNVTISCTSDIPAVDVSSVSATDNCSSVVTHVSDDTTNKTCANRFTLIRTYKATDPAGNYTTCAQIIVVNDNVPPQINGLNSSPQVLWPPDHTMQNVTFGYTVTDNCINNLGTTINITCNEPVSGSGSGNTSPDWQIIDNHHILLRAERNGNGNGRVYTITFTTTDGCNSPVSASTQVMVPRSAPKLVSNKNIQLSTDENSANALSVKIYPNPTSSNFRIEIKSNDTKDLVSMQLIDEYGHIIETRSNIISSSILQIGDSFKPGVYILKVVQGKQQQKIKLVKLADQP